MPIYEYRCDRGHTFEVLQRMADDPVTVCTTCDAKVQRVLHPVAVHFKGSGFYTTDYGRKGGDGSGAESSDTARNGSDKSGSTSTAEKSDGSKAKSDSGSKGSGSKESTSTS